MCKVNISTKHKKKWCSKKRRILMPRTKMRERYGTTTLHGRSTQACQDLLVSATQTRLSGKRGNSNSLTSASTGTKWPHRQTVSNEKQLVLDASSPLTQIDLPQIIEAVLTYLSMQQQYPPTTILEDASTPDYKSKHQLGTQIKCIYNCIAISALIVMTTIKLLVEFWQVKYLLIPQITC